jgi:hypothetical protein
MDFYFSWLSEDFNCLNTTTNIVKPMCETHERDFTACGVMKVLKFPITQA